MAISKTETKSNVLSENSETVQKLNGNTAKNTSNGDNKCKNSHEVILFTSESVGEGHPGLYYKFF